MASLYADNLVYVEGTHPWGNATEIGANTVAAIGMMPSNLQFWNTGDPNSMYMPMPIVQAVEGVEPRLLIQESEAAFVGFSFSVDCDYQAAGTFMDFLTCQDTYMIFKFGMKVRLGTGTRTARLLLIRWMRAILRATVLRRPTGWVTTRSRSTAVTMVTYGRPAGDL